MVFERVLTNNPYTDVRVRTGTYVAYTATSLAASKAQRSGAALALLGLVLFLLHAFFG
jgi:hypothetical protein